MKINSDFFDYEKNLTNMLNNKNKIEIYATPNKRALRKKSEDEKSFNNNNKVYDIKKTDSLSLYEGGRRHFSQRLRRNNDTDLIISDISKDEGSDNRTLFNCKPSTRISGFRSGKSIARLNSLKRNNKFGKKKVSFKHEFVDIIQVESYKKYNLALYDNADAKCSCIIY